MDDGPLPELEDGCLFPHREGVSGGEFRPEDVGQVHAVECGADQEVEEGFDG